jgi:ketosteroid isomerase-like protein
MTTATPDVVSRYFDTTARQDLDAMVGLFAEDAVVIDEGHTYRGTAEIRGWKDGVASKYEYTTTLISSESIGDGTYLLVNRVEGNFPGGVVDLKFRFGVAGDKIRHLEIAP